MPVLCCLCRLCSEPSDETPDTQGLPGNCRLKRKLSLLQRLLFSFALPGTLQMLIKLLLSAGIVYCAACYALLLYGIIAIIVEEKSPDEKTNIEKVLNQFKEGWKNASLRDKTTTLLCCFIFLPSLFLVMAPLIMPFCVVQCYLGGRRAAAELRKHNDYQFVWTNESDLPEEVRKFFDLRTPELLELGFQLDGLYLMKPKPENYYGALFINESGTTVASLTHMFGNDYFGFSSVLESGRCIDTSPTEAIPDLLRFADNPRFTVVFVTDETISSGYQRHQEKLAELFWATDDRVLAFEPEQICDVLQYEGRLFSQELYQYGDQDSPPPAPVLPQALPLAWEYPLFPEAGTSDEEVSETIEL